MKTPTGGLDLVGSFALIVSDVIGMIKDNLPTRHERKVKVGERRLRKKYREVKIETYVWVNFDECTEERQLELIRYYREALNRD